MATFTARLNAIEQADLVSILPEYFSVNKDDLTDFIYNNNVLEIEFSAPTVEIPSYVYFRLKKVIDVGYFREIRLSGVSCLEQINIYEFYNILDKNAFNFVTLKSNSSALCLVRRNKWADDEKR